MGIPQRRMQAPHVVGKPNDAACGRPQPIYHGLSFCGWQTLVYIVARCEQGPTSATCPACCLEPGGGTLGCRSVGQRKKPENAFQQAKMLALSLPTLRRSTLALLCPLPDVCRPAQAATGSFFFRAGSPEACPRNTWVARQTFSYCARVPTGNTLSSPSLLLLPPTISTAVTASSSAAAALQP